VADAGADKAMTAAATANDTRISLVLRFSDPNRFYTSVLHQRAQSMGNINCAAPPHRILLSAAGLRRDD
jgi:hypothetical protein